MPVEYEVVTTVGVQWAHGRIRIQVMKSHEDPPFSFSLSHDSARFLVRAILKLLEEHQP
jgi:hypothetical protein